ncbi:hypothetical protein ACH4E7_27910 [Kitasatospora sp. NPDC018058]
MADVLHRPGADAAHVIAPLVGLPAFEHIKLPWLPITTTRLDGHA